MVAYLVDDENLPTRLCLRTKLYVPTQAYADCKIPSQQRTQLHKEFPRIHKVGHSKTTDAQLRFPFEAATYRGVTRFAFLKLGFHGGFNFCPRSS